MTPSHKPTYLMCAPDHFGVDYVINPWMKGQIGAVDRAKAGDQWEALKAILEDSFGASIEVISGVPGLPDMVFTANAGLVHDQSFVPARFKHAERRGEEAHYERWFRNTGLQFVSVDGFNEGAGDMLFWTNPEGGDVLFAAYGFRTDRCAHSAVAEQLQVHVVTLDLIDPRFYHLDTCFCPLPGGALLWYPPAFSPASVERVKKVVPEGLRFEVSAEDARRFACNAVACAGHVVLNECGAETEAWLNKRGFQVHRAALDEFMKAGGSAKCLTLRTDSGLV